jgi:hypothetical protein
MNTRHFNEFGFQVFQKVIPEEIILEIITFLAERIKASV